jgi:hypothetical protein
MDDQLASFVNSSSAPHHSPMISFDFNVMKQNLTSVQELYRTSAVTVAMFLNCVVILASFVCGWSFTVKNLKFGLCIQ